MEPYHLELSLTFANEGAYILGTFEKHPHLGGQSPSSEISRWFTMTVFWWYCCASLVCDACVFVVLLCVPGIRCVLWHCCACLVCDACVRWYCCACLVCDACVWWYCCACLVCDACE